MTAELARINVQAEVAAITAALEARRDPAYEAGMRRTVPSALPAHATRVPAIRKVATEWTRAHKLAGGEELIALCEALWATGWREEMLVAVMLLSRSKEAMELVAWEVIERWSGQIENWELVDNLAGGVTGPLLRERPSLRKEVASLAGSAHSWQRRLAVVTLIEATRKDPSWAPELQGLAAKLRSDRGPTMRKAVAWALKTLRDLEANGD
jgi:3-methyladenine DNA glycosylase AlkD